MPGAGQAKNVHAAAAEANPAFVSSSSARPKPRQCFAQLIAGRIDQQPKWHPISVAQSISGPYGLATRPSWRKQVHTPNGMGTIYGSCLAHSNRKSGSKNVRSGRIKVTIYGMELPKTCGIRPRKAAFLP